MTGKLPVRCLDCRALCQPAPNQNGRCPRCSRARDVLRNRLRDHYKGHWPTIRRALIAAHPWCQVCRWPGSADNPLTADHIVPVAHGGTHQWSNLQVLCRVCNSAKGSRE